MPMMRNKRIRGIRKYGDIYIVPKIKAALFINQRKIAIRYFVLIEIFEFICMILLLETTNL